MVPATNSNHRPQALNRVRDALVDGGREQIPPGIWVVDAKRYHGRPELKIEGGIIRPRAEKLLVGGRDCTKLVDGVLKQVDAVRHLAGDVSVTGALCFVEADWPQIGGSFSTTGVHILWPKRLARLLA